MFVVPISYSPCLLSTDWILTMPTACWLATHHVADLQLVPLHSCCSVHCWK